MSQGELYIILVDDLSSRRGILIYHFQVWVVLDGGAEEGGGAVGKGEGRSTVWILFHGLHRNQFEMTHRPELKINKKQHK